MESQDGHRMVSNMYGDNHSGLAVGQHTGTINFHAYAGDDTAKILEGLSSSYRQQKDLNPQRTTGTCEWLLQDATFVKWRDTPHSGLIHIYAAPGSGKSVLARCLIDEKLLSHNPVTPVLYYFFKRGQGEQDRSTKALTAMLHQLYTDHPDVGEGSFQKRMVPLYKKHSEKIFGMFNELFDTLVSSVTSIDCEIICIFDALDECEEHDRERLSSALATYFSNRLTQPPSVAYGLKVVLTSRPDSGIEDAFASVQHLSNIIRLDGYKRHALMTNEINHAIEDMVPHAIPRVSKNVQREIVEHLQGLANSTYLWLHLTLEHLKGRDKGHRTSRKLKELIDELPPTLEEGYNYMLLKSKDPGLTKSLLSIVISAVRPLSVEEINIALELDRSKYCYQYMDEFDLEATEDFENSIRDLCGALLSIHDSRVYFVHETARAFLLTHTEWTGNASTSWKHSIQESQVKQILARVCISYLCLRDFESMALDLKDEETSSRYKTKGSRVLFFLDYAAKNWAMHYREVQDKIHNEVAEQLRKIVPATWTLPEYWSELYEPVDYVEYDWWRPLLFCASTGLHHMVGQLLAEGVEVNEPRDHQIRRSALHVASSLGHTKVARTLLQYGAEVDALSFHNYTALHDAAQHGHKETVTLLLEYGADVDLLNGIGWKPLWYAAFYGRLEVVQALIENGADVAAVDRISDTYLHWACRRDYPEVAICLLEHGAHIDAQNEFGELPLHDAAGRGHLRIVHLLLRRGASVNSQDGDQRTALHIASSADCEDIVWLLLQNGADASIRDKHRRTAFHLAIRKKNQTAARVLREFGADATYNEDVALGKLDPKNGKWLPGNDEQPFASSESEWSSEDSEAESV